MLQIKNVCSIVILLSIILSQAFSYPGYSSNSSNLASMKLVCPSNCKTCGGIFNDICTSCHPGEYLSSSGTCVSCDEYCLLCTGPDSQTCTSCKTELYYLIDGRCEKLQRQLQTSNINLPTSSFTVSSILTVYFTFNNDADNTIDFYVVFNAFEWVGIGFGVTMPTSDIITFEIVNNAVVVSDRYATQHAKPPLDTSLGGTNDVTLVAYSLNSTTLVAQINRKQNTGDKYDYVLNGPGNYSMISATSTTQTISFHENNHYSFTADLVSGSTTTVTANSDISSRSYYLQVHGIMMTIVWGFLAEIASYLPRYFRAWKYYSQAHGFIAFSILVCNTVFFAIPIYWDNDLSLGYKNGSSIVVAHFALGVSLYILACMQHIGGIGLKKRLENHKETESVYKMRRGHMISGMLLLAISKAQLLIGVINGYSAYTGLMIGYVVFSVGLRIIVEIVYRIRFHKKGSETWEKRALTGDQTELLKMIANNASKSEIKNKLPRIKWVLLGNKVVDVSNLIHPGGNFVLEEVYGREIGRFFYGAYSLEIAKLTKPYNHSGFALGLLHQFVIGEMNVGDGMLTGSKDGEEQIQDPMIVKAGLVSSGKIWTLTAKDKLTDSISRFSFKSSEFLVKNHVKGVEWMGKHFVLQFTANPPTRLYTTVLCMTDDNVALRKWAIRNFDVLMGKENSNALPFPTDIKKAKSELPLVIKKYDYPNAFSKKLHETNISGSSSVSIEGPVGRGLELSGKLKGSYVILAAGTGIFPFLDWLNYYLMKSMLDVLKKKGVAEENLKAMNVHEEVYSETFDESFSIVLYGSFANEREMVGLDIVEKLAELGKAYGVKFAASFRGFGTANIDQLQGKFDREFLKKSVGGDAERVMICGPPSFNREIVEGLRQQGLSEEKIQLV